MDSANLVTVPTRHIERLCNPALDDVWGCGRITVEDVLRCDNVQAGQFHADHENGDAGGDWVYNVARIAYLMEFGWEVEDDEPILIDLGGEGYFPSNPVLDGNHRVSAAIFRDDPFIRVLAIGDDDRIQSVLFEGKKLEEFDDEPLQLEYSY